MRYSIQSAIEYLENQTNCNWSIEPVISIYRCYRAYRTDIKDSGVIHETTLKELINKSLESFYVQPDLKGNLK